VSDQSAFFTISISFQVLLLISVALDKVTHSLERAGSLTRVGDVLTCFSLPHKR
jgi:hypothetical protein